jgi:HSP20 family protein
MNLPSLFRDNESWPTDAFRQLNRMQKQMDRLFGSAPASDWGASYVPSCDVKEAGNHYVISMDIPGMSKDQIKVELEGDMLTISGERHEEKEEKEKNRMRTERFYGSFARSFTLPTEVKPEDIATEYKDGVLRIAVPKAAASTVSGSKQIKIGEGKPGFFDKLLGSDKGAGKVA